MRAHIIVTWGAGVIGAHSDHPLVADGHEAIGIDWVRDYHSRVMAGGLSWNTKSCFRQWHE